MRSCDSGLPETCFVGLPDLLTFFGTARLVDIFGGLRMRMIEVKEPEVRPHDARRVVQY